MKQKNTIQKAVLATIFMMLVQAVFASFTTSGSSGSAGKNKGVTSNYTLKNLSKYSNKNLTFNTIRYNTRLKATDFTHTQNGNSTVQMSNGNTTFILPYKVKIKVPKFKTPTRPNF